MVPDLESMLTTPPVTTPACAVDVGLNLELLHGVDDGKEAIDGAAEIGVDDSIHVVEGFAVLLTEE